jgi:hypothetical protein
MNEALSEIAERITSENANLSGPNPPAAARLNPMMELLFHSVIRWLPAQLAEKAAALTDADDLIFWVGLGALARYLPDGLAQQEFWAAVTKKPEQTAEAWARLMARSTAPPPRRSTADVLPDVYGLFLQLALLAEFFACRCLIVWIFADPGKEWSWPRAAFLVPLMNGPVQFGNGLFVGLIAGLALMIVEFCCAPLWMERLRAWPTRGTEQMPTVSPHIDAFRFLWRAQALGIFVLLVLRFL